MEESAEMMAGGSNSNEDLVWQSCKYEWDNPGNIKE